MLDLAPRLRHAGVMRSKLLSAAAPGRAGPRRVIRERSPLLVDYLRPAPVFCAEGGGCDAVKHTVFAAPLGVPMPAFGALGFAVLAVLLMLSGPRVRTLHLVAAVLGAIVGAGLIGVQLLLRTLCPYCLVSDVSACLACGVAIWRFKGGWDLDASGAYRGALAAVVVAVPGAVLAFGLNAKVHLPDVIAEEMSKAPKGQATVVEFVDFECPFCRDEYADLAPMLSEEKDHVRVVRKLVPLTKIHPHALEAARAACCADLLGKGDAMADALTSTPPSRT